MSLIEKMMKKTAFSSAEKHISDYILTHCDEMKDMTISELAKATYTSNPAIIRFCRKVGTSGYKEFKISFVLELEKRRTNKTFVDYNYPFHKDESTYNILNNIANLSKSTIDVVYNNINHKAIQEISNIIFNSQNVYMYALGDSLIRGMSFQNKLIKLNKHIINTAVLGEQTVYTTHATHKDCALFITYSAQSSELLYNAQTLKRNKVPIILITSNNRSPIANLADYKIIIPNYENTFDNIATFYSQIAFEYILNTLYSIIYNMHFSENHKRKDKTSALQQSFETKK